MAGVLTSGVCSGRCVPVARAPTILRTQSALFCTIRGPDARRLSVLGAGGGTCVPEAC